MMNEIESDESKSTNQEEKSREVEKKPTAYNIPLSQELKDELDIVSLQIAINSETKQIVTTCKMKGDIVIIKAFSF
jgi:hypothetical protein